MKKKERGEGAERRSLRERVSRALDIPPDLLPGGSLLELRGRSELTVRGGGKILRYTPEEICIALSDDTLSVRGRRLTCTSYYVGAIGIEGQIDEVTFGDAVECRGEGGRAR